MYGLHGHSIKRSTERTRFVFSRDKTLSRSTDCDVQKNYSHGNAEESGTSCVCCFYFIDDSATHNCLSFGQILLLNSAASNTTTLELSRSVKQNFFATVLFTECKCSRSASTSLMIAAYVSCDVLKGHTCEKCCAEYNNQIFNCGLTYQRRIFDGCL